MAGLTTFLARTGYHEGMDVIYADELVALNALIDYLLLVLSARAAELPVRRGRSALAGLLGEWRAARYLKRRGYQILEKRYRAGHNEIDLICRSFLLMRP